MPKQILIATTLLLLLPTFVFATNLWYNGDWNFQTGLSNGSNYQFQDAWIFDDFVAPASWQVSGLFSNNFSLPGTVGASARWEIRSGVSSGVGGILVAGGTSTAFAIPTGRVSFQQTEYTILVTGLSIGLAPGHYWLSVAPIDSGTGSNPFVSSTNGANCMGSPCGNNGGAFYYEPPNPPVHY